MIAVIIASETERETKMKNKDKINKYLIDLDWNQSPHVLNEAMEHLVNLIDESNVRLLLQPYDKPWWKNSAIVLTRIDSELVKLLFPEILEWIQDLNWPGADIVFGLIIDIVDDKIRLIIDETIVKAKEINDSTWIYSLELLKNSLD